MRRGVEIGRRPRGAVWRKSSLLICAALAWAGCTAGPDSPAPDESSAVAEAPPTQGDMDAGAQRQDDTRTSIEDVQLGDSLEVMRLEYSSSEDNPLAGRLLFETAVEVTPVVRVARSGREFVVPDSGLISGPMVTSHEVWVVGLRSSTEYTLQVHGVDGDGVEHFLGQLAVLTGALPADFPPIEVVRSDPELMETGATFFGVSRSKNAAKPGSQEWGMLVGLDEEGAVIWYRAFAKGIGTAQRQANGNLAFLLQPSTVIEINILGETLAWWSAEDLGVIDFHHELYELPSGNMMTLVPEIKTISGYPDGSTYNVVGDVAVEFTREGEVVHSWSMLELLDPYRVLPGFHRTFWDKLFPDQEAKDWSHANAVVRDPIDQGLIFSLRHQDLVFKLDPGSGEMVWALGQDDPLSDGDDEWPFFALESPGLYPDHQHAPHLLPSGNMMLYDNGNTRGYTRVVEYALDFDNLTATQVWEFVDPDFSPPLFCRSLGDADWQPSGTVLITDGSVVTKTADGDLQWARLLEVLHDETQQKVFEVRVRDASGEQGYRIYRAERLRGGFYPGVSSQ